MLICRLADTHEAPLGTSFTQIIPEDLHDMLRAGLSNAISQVADILPVGGFGFQEESEHEIDGVVNFFMEKLAMPAPQMERFIRQKPVRIEDLCEEYGPGISVQFAHRIFEQELYDFGRSMGLSQQQATGHVIKAREDSSKHNIDLPELGDYESSECKHLLDFLDTYPEPEVLPCVEEPKDLRYVNEDKIGNPEQRLAESNSKVAMKAANKTKEEIAATKEAKKARQQAESVRSQKSNDHQEGRLEQQKPLTSNPEDPPNVQPLEDQEKPLKQKKKGRKRKRELDLPIQSEEPSEHHHRHKKGRVDSDAQYDNVKKTKRKEARPQHSPFFQRSSGPKAKKKSSGKKTEQQTGFQPPMIQ